jgi:hypothetical protein
MGKIDLKETCLPTEQQEWLLKAALLKGPESIQSWEKWINGTDINSLDLGSQRLLPLLFNNLHSQNISHPILNKFKGVYRQTWYRNQMLFKEMSSVIRSFHEAGIETMVIKGAALVIVHYKDIGLRPMDDFDLLVPSQKIIPAIDQLKQLKWRTKFPLDKLTDNNIPYQRAFHFRGPSGHNLDLHRHIQFESLEANADQDFWDGSIPILAGGMQTLALNPTDQLLHTCVHGLMWNEVPPLRWVADAVMILRTTRVINWERLLIQSEKWGVCLTMRETLQYLSSQMHAPVPAQFLNRFQKITITDLDRMEFKVYNHPPGLTGQLPKRWYIYSSRFVKASGILQRLLGFPRFLQHFWTLDSLALVPFHAMGRGLHRLGSLLFGLPGD